MLYVWVKSDGTICSTSRQEFIPDKYKNAVVVFENLTVTDADKLVIDNGKIRQKTQEELLGEAKQAKLRTLISQTQSYIEKYYPDIKQRSDLADKAYWGSWLIAHNSNYTDSGIRQKVYSYAAQIIEGAKSFNDVVSGLPQNEQLAWEQLIKVALRVAFIQSVKKEYYQLKQQIESAKTLDDLKSITVKFQTKPPEV